MMPHRAQGGSNDPASWFETRGVAALLTMRIWRRGARPPLSRCERRPVVIAGLVPPLVVPANAGTHNHRLAAFKRTEKRTPASIIIVTEYRSLLPQGRQ